jgi:hypothetical protein
MTTGRILNIPNILTLARIALIPVFLLVAYWPPVMGIAEQAVTMSRHILLTSIFVVAAVTDWFDGYLARTLNQTSAFGRFLDPVADKLMGVGPEISSCAARFDDGIERYFFPNTEALLKSELLKSLHSEVILIKGSRVFNFDLVSEALELKVHETIWEVI